MYIYKRVLALKKPNTKRERTSFDILEKKKPSLRIELMYEKASGHFIFKSD